MPPETPAPEAPTSEAPTPETPAPPAPEIAAALAPLEAVRQQLLRKRKITLATFGGAAGLCALLVPAGIAAHLPELATTAGAALPAALIFMIVLAVRISSKYATAYKRDIGNLLVRRISPGLRYDENDGIGPDAFMSSGLFSHLFSNPNYYTSSDLVAGTLGKTKLRLARVDAEQRGDKDNSSRTIFEGMLLVADFNKNFRGRVCVRTDIAEKLLGSLGRVFQKTTHILSAEKLVQLENPEFEKAFAVYADDQVEARYILTPALMDRMLALKTRLGAGVQFSFHDSSIVVAIPRPARDTALLAASLTLPADDPAQLAANQRRLAFYLGIIDDLDLNTRIWSKE